MSNAKFDEAHTSGKKLAKTLSLQARAMSKLNRPSLAHDVKLKKVWMTGG
jgi:hypothetical protein